MKSKFPITPRRVVGVLVSALTLALLLPGPACACDCAIRSDEEMFADADQVYIAELAASDSGIFGNARDTTHTFTVETVHKGVVTRTQNVLSATDPIACGWAGQPGKKYLVFASAKDGALTISGCTTRSADKPLDINGVKNFTPEPDETTKDSTYWMISGATASAVVLLILGYLLHRRLTAR